MNSKEFVDVIKAIVRDAAINDGMAIAENPPGRKISEGQKVRAEWLHSLNTDERRFLKSVVSEAVDQAIFGFLCMLDGVRAVEDGSDQGKFELWYSNGESVLLNSETGTMLHDLYNA